jgi:hypothetical protein
VSLQRFASESTEVVALPGVGSCVFVDGKDLQVLNPVVELVPVDVVDVLRGQEFATEVPFHDEAVLTFGFAIHPNLAIPEYVNTTLPEVVRGAVADPTPHACGDLRAVLRGLLVALPWHDPNITRETV